MRRAILIRIITFVLGICDSYHRTGIAQLVSYTWPDLVSNDRPSEHPTFTTPFRVYKKNPQYAIISSNVRQFEVSPIRLKFAGPWWCWVDIVYLRSYELKSTKGPSNTTIVGHPWSLSARSLCSSWSQFRPWFTISSTCQEPEQLQSQVWTVLGIER